MAVDTRDKRAGCLRINGQYRGPLPVPSGTIGLAQRRQLVGCYPGDFSGALGASGSWIELARAITWTELARTLTWTELARALTWSTTAVTTLVKRASEFRKY